MESQKGDISRRHFIKSAVLPRIGYAPVELHNVNQETVLNFGEIYFMNCFSYNRK